MELRERCLCLVLFMFLVVAVFSTVSIFYLTAIVYWPSYSELGAGISPRPVRCITLARKEQACEATEWTSCWEWCLSAPTGKCTTLEVTVRNNGSDLAFNSCKVSEDFTCPHYDEDTSYAYYCKGLDNYSCQNMTGGVHECMDGVCIKHTTMFTCTFNTQNIGPVVDCKQPRQCVELTGMFDCEDGRCTQFHAPWKCSRICPDYQMEGVNVVIVSRDRTVTARCDSIKREKETILSDSNIGALLLSCSELDGNLRGGSFNGRDCTNASFIVTKDKPVFSFSQLRYQLAQKPFIGSPSYIPSIPFEEDLVLQHRGRLKINHQGCVNTLSSECLTFQATHRYDGSNDTARSVFPCFTSDREDFVFARYEPDETRRFFLILCILPMSVWFGSCSCVYLINFCIVIDSRGRFTIGTRQQRHMVKYGQAASAEVVAVMFEESGKKGKRNKRPRTNV